MRKVLVSLMLVAGVACGQSFTDVNSPQYHGWQELNAAIDANFALLESGSVDASVDTLTVDNGASIQGAVTSISTNGATTNVLVTVDAVIDGEYIKDDTIDDDSIDFSDVTGADLTLTDCGAITCTSLSTGTGEATVDGKYAVVGPGTTTALMLDASSVTIGAGGTVTVTWSTAFGAVPFPVASYAEDAGADTVLEWGSVTTSNAILTGAASKSAYWQAIGARP